MTWHSITLIRLWSVTIKVHGPRDKSRLHLLRSYSFNHKNTWPDFQVNSLKPSINGWWVWCTWRGCGYINNYMYTQDCNFSNLYLQLLLIRLGAAYTRPNNKMSLRQTLILMANNSSRQSILLAIHVATSVEPPLCIEPPHTGSSPRPTLRVLHQKHWGAWAWWRGYGYGSA